MALRILIESIGADARNDFLWLGTVCNIIFDSSLRRGELEKSKLILNKLFEMGSSGTGVQQQSELYYRKAQYLLACEDYDQASYVLRDNIFRCEQACIHSEVVRNKLLLSRVFLECDSASMSAQYVLSCIEICENRMLRQLKTECLLLLAEIKLNLGFTRRCGLLIESAIHNGILQNGSPSLTGALYRLLCMCHLRSIRSSIPDSNDLIDRMLEYCKKAVYAFEQIESVRELRELYWSMSHLHNIKGNGKEKMKYAELFDEVQQNETPKFSGYSSTLIEDWARQEIEAYYPIVSSCSDRSDYFDLGDESKLLSALRIAKREDLAEEAIHPGEQESGAVEKKEELLLNSSCDMEL